ncbi:hypothetical protein BV25DRAFT_199260 [Artomyces pyxidatus]|uniref:Uncharacterized protein n=1 Tax=Artomyces pyxidatus TaxID=48021 RepID=A0ACB8T8R3_9AGAM|nr:hypothetical protein BV25DRAFT_199260 [Artomyces pyxidatus]
MSLSNIQEAYIAQTAKPKVSPSSMFVCPHPPCPCGHANLPSVAALIEHVLSSPWAASYYCSLCRSVCRNEQVLRTHMQRVHPKSAPAPIRPTSTSSSRAQLAPSRSLQRPPPPPPPQQRPAPPHLQSAPVPLQPTPAQVPARPNPAPPRVQTPSPQFACPTCNRMYSSSPALLQHYRDAPVHPKCSRCNLGFADNAAIQSHVATVHRPITCEACNGLQVYREDVSNHYRISPNHPSCQVCNIGFENGNTFEEHIKSNHPEFRCQACNLSFGSNALLNAHYQESSSHPTCPECQVSFIDNVTLVQHVISVFNPLIRGYGKLILESSQMSQHSSFSTTSRASTRTGSPGFRSPGVVSVRLDLPSKAASSPGASYVRTAAHIADLAPASAVQDDESDGYSPNSTHSSIASLSSPSVISAPYQRASLFNDDAPEMGNMGKSPIRESLPVVPSPNQLAPAPNIFDSPDTNAAVLGRQVAAAWLEKLEESTQASTTPVADNENTLKTARSTSSSSTEDFVDISATRTSTPKPVVLSRHDSPSMRSACSLQHVENEVQRPSTPKRQSWSGSVTVTSPAHVVYPSAEQPQRFRIVHSRGASRAASLSIASDNRGPSLGELLRASSRRQSVSVLSPHSLIDAKPASVTAAPRALSPRPDLWQTAQSTPRGPPREIGTETTTGDNAKLVSYIYCRHCRRDPCRQPTATMCGHIFCHSCISTEVAKTSRCPVCEAPTLLYSLFRLQVA